MCPAARLPDTGAILDASTAGIVASIASRARHMSMLGALVSCVCVCVCELLYRLSKRLNGNVVFAGDTTCRTPTSLRASCVSVTVLARSRVLSAGLSTVSERNFAHLE